MENQIGKNIRNRRKELNLTQNELARKLGYKTGDSISKIEKGENAFPYYRLNAFAEALCVTSEELAGWSNGTITIEHQTQIDSLPANEVSLETAIKYALRIADETRTVDLNESQLQQIAEYIRFTIGR